MSDLRRLVVLDGDRLSIRLAAQNLVGADTTWLAGGARKQARALLGQGRRDVVWELEDGFDADVLGMLHGVIEAGGRLIVLKGPWTPAWKGTAVWPHAEGGRRMEERLERPLPEPVRIDADPLADQGAVVERLVRHWEDGPGIAVLTADRGRGKSAALGLAVKGRRGRVTSPTRAAAAEVLRFAPDATWVDAETVCEAELLVVDEAAMFPIPVLEALIQRNPRARLVFATTVHGYEGTGRGFAIRFLPRLREQGALELTLTHPIRWRAGDPLERWVYDVLALDAAADGHLAGPLRIRRVDPDELASDESLLRQVFGLLVEAHYRTTPADLQRLLDGPNLRLFVAERQGVVGVNLVALEGGFDPAAMERLARGERFRGHALPDTLFHHAGCRELARTQLVRSVRIAVRHDQRRQGIASALVEAVHDAFPDAVFGTLFGATPDVLRFRRAHGYHLVRIGIARGARSGEPTAVMLRGGGLDPSSSQAAAIERLRAELARDAPVLLDRLARAPVPASQHLLDAFRTGLLTAPPWTEAALHERLEAFRRGRPFESVLPALVELDRQERLAVEPQVLDLVRGHRTWLDLTGWPSIAATMRGVRAQLLDGVLPRV